MQKILLGYQSYEGDSAAQVGQRLLNMYAEKTPDIAGMSVSRHQGMQFMLGAKYPWNFLPTPGQKLWLDLGTGSSVQGMQVMGDNLYAVSANQVYKVNSNAGKTLLGGGPISGIQDRVDMANNGTQMGIVAADGTGWVATTGALAKITDPNYPAAGCSSIAYLDSYGLFPTLNSIQFQPSANYDLTTISADFASMISSPTNIVRVSSFNSALWFFLQKAFEVWQNTGAAAFPFEQVQGVANTTRGLAAKFAVVDDDNTLFFFADDLIVYRINGYVPSRISSHALEVAIQHYKSLYGSAGITDAFMMKYTMKGHKFVVLTFPTAGATWVFDVSQGLWHERGSHGRSSSRWSPNCMVDFAGKTLVGDYENGKIYELDPLTYSDDGNMIQRIAQGAVVWSDSHRITHDRIRLDVDAGQGLAFGQGSDPQVVMTFSDDGGQTYSDERWQPIGKMGQYKNMSIWERNGQSRERIYKFMFTDPCPFRITGCYGDFRIGKA